MPTSHTSRCNHTLGTPGSFSGAVGSSRMALTSSLPVSGCPSSPHSWATILLMWMSSCICRQYQS